MFVDTSFVFRTQTKAQSFSDETSRLLLLVHWMEGVPIPPARGSPESAPHHKAEVPSIQPGTISAAPCDFDADEILQFNKNEVVYRSAGGSGHTSGALAALHGRNDDGASFWCDCHSNAMRYPLVNRNTMFRPMRFWDVPREWDDLCECCGFHSKPPVSTT